MSSDRSKCEQVVYELLCKVAELVVSSRVSLIQPQRREVNSKFSLHVQELAFVRNSMKAWENNLTLPLGIDIFWVEGGGDGAPRRELLERWEIMYEAQDAAEGKSAQLRHFFKRSIILLRTLYSLVRLLPAYSVHKRIQSRDVSLADSRDDTGFSLYPLRDGGSCGSGLDFSASGGEDHAGRSGRKSTSCYTFKPLKAPHGSVKVICHYRRGVDSKAYQHGQTNTVTAAPDMTTSLIPDYVTDEYERNAAASRMPATEVNHDWPKLPSTPEDGASVPDGAVDAYGQHAGNKVSKENTSMMHWPSPELGHGYAEKRTHIGPRQGPAPFLTPGPHRGRPLGRHDVMMEPLELGPNAEIHARGPPHFPAPPVRQENEDLIRVSAQTLSGASGRTESNHVDSHCSNGMIRTAEGGEDGVADRGRALMRPYRRNSISESLSTPSGSGGSRITAGHRHSTAIEYTPPFSYNTTGPDLGERNIALGQPLVSFSPPFNAVHVGQRGHDSTFSIRVHSSGPRAPVPTLLEVLPESPFALRKEGTQPPGVPGTAVASSSRPFLPRLDCSSQEPTFAATSAGIDRTELPFAAELQDDGVSASVDSSVCGVEGGLDSSAAPSTLYALCSAASSKSIFLADPSSEYAEQTAVGFLQERDSNDVPSPGAEYTSTAGSLPQEVIVRSLEEDLEGFRLFQQEVLEQRR
ncbi:conserved unknown protein [Ectocarpus siliculosus]|uniref:Autophagy-related protein 13 N-terminal domain-containing protein n=1 Tax=Ectocarpus siliculosus TaxID=2880 RepID=D7FKW0_ECTSI|nr:conserved unknown protein [Ectocarpus siliculosus]|eukprot:CBJ29505.1 conserved unknown protein [Ectocarpus siliculosus]